jgi:zinc transport system substrate-binding protein
MIKKIILAFSIVCLAAGVCLARENHELRIGVTLHPYYSFVKNIVGGDAHVEPLISKGFNPHNYRPQPDDIKRCLNLNVLVVNGIGHDEFAFEILKASNMQGKLAVIQANKDVSLIPVSGNLEGKKMVNPHTFVSVTASIQQIHTISRALQKLDPDHAAHYRKNTRAYVRKLRRMKAKYMKRVMELPEVDFRCATIHGGYDYLLQEFGLQVTAVIEPGHGLKPTANQLAKTIDAINKLGVDVIFTEMDFPEKYVDTIQAETGVRIRHLSHLTAGEYTADSFAKGIEANLEALTHALVEAHDLKKREAK